MDDLISRQAAIDVAVNYHLAHDITHIPNTRWDDGFKTGWNLRENDIIHGLEELPTAQLEIIQCKDCRHYDTHDHRCKVWNHGVIANGFCHEALRKDGGGA